MMLVETRAERSAVRASVQVCAIAVKLFGYASHPLVSKRVDARGTTQAEATRRGQAGSRGRVTQLEGWRDLEGSRPRLAHDARVPGLGRLLEIIKLMEKYASLPHTEGSNSRLEG